MTSSFETNKVYSILVDENGTLSGYVTDPAMNPIEGAKVRVYFHETYEEDYSDSSGYYHVTNIPICYCLKNATVSKEGYTTEWVLLAIGENTTLDFVLTPLGKTLYVGGSGPNNYTRIQDAIDNASDLDTIFVFSGTYYENLIIDKSINLLGEDRENTSIDGKNAANEGALLIWIQADSVTVSFFTIKNSNNNIFRLDKGITLSNSNYFSIHDNTILNCQSGMRILNSSGYIRNNSILRTKDYGDKGIGVWDSDVNIIDNNITGKYFRGILTVSSNSNISGNIVKEAKEGIRIADSEIGTTIIGNHIEDNDFGVFIESSVQVKVEKNNFINNQDAHAAFFNCFRTIWKNNYWDRPRILPKPILGFIWGYPSIPILNFDWNPALLPLDVLSHEVIIE